MLLNPLIRPLTVPLAMVALALNTVAAAQTAHRDHDSLRVMAPMVVPPQLRRALAAPRHTREVASQGCRGEAPAACRVVESPASTLPAVLQDSRRGQFALVGLVAGAAIGWGWYAYQCSHGDDCYSPVGGVLLAVAGGALGLLVGLLVAPGPG